RAASPLETAALFAAFLGALALHGTRAFVVPATGGLLRALAHPPTGVVVGLSAALAIVLALALRQRTPDVRRPWLLLLLAPAPFIPLLGGRALVLLAFTPPVVMLLATAAAGASLAASQLRVNADRIPALALWIAGFVVYVLVGMRIPGPAGPQ